MHQAALDIRVSRFAAVLLLLLNCIVFYGQVTKRESDYKNKLLEATELYQKKYYSKALLRLNKITVLYPEKSASFYLLSKIYEEAGYLKKYEEYAEKAFIRDTANIEYLNNLINAYHVNNNNILLKKYLLKAIPGRKEIDYKILLALTDFTGFDENSTIKQLSVLEKENPDNDQIIIIKYQVYNFLKKTDSAKNEILKLVQRNPDDIRFRLSLVNTYRQLKDTSQYIKQLDIIDSLDRSLDNTWMLRADYYVSRNNSSEIKEYLQNIISKNSVDTLRKLQIIGVVTSKVNDSLIYSNDLIKWLKEVNYSKKHFSYLIWSNYYESKLRLEQSVKYLTRYAVTVKTDYAVWTKVLQYYYQKGDYRQCFLYCDTLESFRENFLPNYYRIMSYYQMKDYDNLSKTVSKSKIEKYANDEFKTFLYNVLALSCYESGKIKKSYKYYEKIIKIDTTDLVTFNNYAYFLSLKKKKLKLAERMSRRTIEAEPYSSTYLDTYAWILFKMKNYHDALFYIEEAIRNNGITNGEIMDHYGDILFKIGNHQNAVDAWKIANQLEPNKLKEDKIRKYSTN